MKIETWMKILIGVLLLNLAMSGVNYFKSDPVTVTAEDIQNILDTQREELQRKTNNNVRNKAIKTMVDVTDALGDPSKYDSLRTRAFGL